MRSNGLTASSYTPIADLDPRVADALLGELRKQGVAAYTKPVESTSTSGFDRPEFRTNVLDRLYVDAVEGDRVKGLISEQNPELIVENDDLTWAQIVAGFDQPVTDDVTPWPVTEDLDAPPDDPADDRAEAPNRTELDTDDTDDPRDRRSELRGWLSSRDATGSPGSAADDEVGSMRTHDDDAEEAPERFVPPPPPPLPQLEPWQQLAWVGLIGGPLLMLVSVLFSISLPGWVSLIAVAGFMGGFIALVAGMKDQSDSDDDPGSGAVV